jgi:hypothetical protein
MSVPSVGPAFFPLDKAWGLGASVYSPELQRDMVWLSGLLPYGQAAAVMERIGKRALSESSLWRTTQRQGYRLMTEAPSTETEVTISTQKQPLWAWGKMLSMDGGMVNIRQEGWKELKVGLVGQVVSAEHPDTEFIPEVHTVPLGYTAVLGDVEAFTPLLVRTAQTHGFFDVPQSSIVADGAAWIWGIADRHFPHSVQIVDWYHAGAHLADAAQARFPDQPALATAWLQTQRQVLFEGSLNALLADLNQVGLSETAHYFDTHQARMHYTEFQEAGLPIASGSVESAVKQFKQRLTAPGMNWSRPGAERMIPIRAAVLDQSFDARWASSSRGAPS